MQSKSALRWLLLGLGALAILAACFFVIRLTSPGNKKWGITQREWTEVIINGNLVPPLERFKAHTGRYPTTEEGLQALLSPPADLTGKWHGPYLDKNKTWDVWHRQYLYRCPGIHNPQSYDLWSLGPDKARSDDDIGNW